MSRRVEVESRRLLLDDFFKVEEAYLRHEMPDGELGPRVRRLDFERGDAVAALIVNRDAGTCVLARQFRYPAYKHGQGWLTEIPAGVVDDGEEPEAAIRREILEEVGYRAGELMPIATVFPSPGGSSERIFLFFAPVGDGDRVEGEGGGVADEDEDIEILELPLDEVMAALDAGEMVDGKTVTALTWLALARARGEVDL